jgi:hypothetical protein
MSRYRQTSVQTEAPSEPLFKMELPTVKPINFKTGALVFAGVSVIGVVAMGAAIGTQIFFGAVTLGGLIALMESNKYLKWIVIHGNIFIDIAIFIASIYATAMLGVSIAGALTFAGLGYSLAYAPYVRRQQQMLNNK